MALNRAYLGYYGANPASCWRRQLDVSMATGGAQLMACDEPWHATFPTATQPAEINHPECMS